MEGGGFKRQTVQLTSSRVRLGQSFKTVGCGCTSCWGDLGAGSVEADVFYIPFIVSVQYITRSTGSPEEAAGVTRATVRTTGPVPVDSRQ